MADELSKISETVWDTLKNAYEKPSPTILHSYYLDLIAQMEREHTWDSLLNYHPVMSLRILISQIYNPLRVRRFADMVKRYFPRIYYDNKMFHDLLDLLADYSGYDIVLMQIVAFLIAQVFSIAETPQNRSDQIDAKKLASNLEHFVNQIIKDSQQIFTESDSNCLKVFDRTYTSIESLNNIDIPFFPIPGGDLHFLRVFQNICKNTPPPSNIVESVAQFQTLKKDSRHFSRFDPLPFMPQILPREFIEPLMDSYYESLVDHLPENNYREFEEFDTVFKFLLFEFSMVDYQEMNYYHFQSLCKEHNLKWDLIERYMLRTSDLVRKNGKPILFSAFQEIYNKPLLWVKSDAGKQYKYNMVIISWPLLFDAYLSHLVSYYRISSVGKKRGQLLEDTVATLVKEKLFADPFKLVLVNKNLSQKDPAMRELLHQTHDFPYSRILIKVDPNDVGIPNFRYREFDVGFFYNGSLYFIEAKDNIVVETQDHPDLCLKWAIANLKKIRGKEKLLKLPVIHMKVEEAFNHKFNQVRGIFVSNTSFGIYRCFSIGEFQDHLLRMQQRLQFDEIRQKVLDSLKAAIDQQEILRDYQKQSAYLRQAFDLTRACKRYYQAVDFGWRLLQNLDKSYYFDDKLLLVLQLADSYAQLGKFQDALNILHKAQFNVQLKNEPELGFLYFFNRGQWFYQVGQTLEATQDFIQAEKIARGKEIDHALLRILFAFLCKLHYNSLQSDYYQKKLRTYVDADINLEEFIERSTMIEQSHR